MKDEFKGKIINEFAGLNSKIHSLALADGKENKRAKGVNTNVVKNRKHKEVVDTLCGGKLMTHRM